MRKQKGQVSFERGAEVSVAKRDDLNRLKIWFVYWPRERVRGD